MTSSKGKASHFHCEKCVNYTQIKKSWVKKKNLPKINKTSSLKKKKAKVGKSHTECSFALLDYQILSRIYIERTLSSQKNKHDDQKILKMGKRFENRQFPKIVVPSEHFKAWPDQLEHWFPSETLTSLRLLKHCGLPHSTFTYFSSKEFLQVSGAIQG